MWVGKFRVVHDDWIRPKTLKYNVKVTGTPLGSFEKDGIHYHSGAVFLNGSKEEKDAFINSLHDDPKVVQFDQRGNQLIVLIEGIDAITHIFDPSLFFITPVIMTKGEEVWELGSWNKSSLITFYEQAKALAEVEILKLKQEYPTLFIQQAAPHLTKKQRDAVELALAKGYYTHPRKVSVEELAKSVNTPRTTFQEHLRKAEGKLMNVLFQKSE